MPERSRRGLWLGRKVNAHERLLGLGPQTLTDAELSAILLLIGFKGTSAVEHGCQLVSAFRSMRAFTVASLNALDCRLLGVLTG